jgi:class 3 adenylate cyclase
VDLSGYSRISAALAAKSAHALSQTVNKYLGLLLHIAHLYGGDVVKFAGDAVLIIWETNAALTSSTSQCTLDHDDSTDHASNIHRNVWCAARCGLEMQTKAGMHIVEGTPHVFRIHIGLSCGILESEVFEAPVHVNMQCLYHSVGGDVLDEISDLVDLAAAGELPRVFPRHCASGSILGRVPTKSLLVAMPDRCHPAAPECEHNAIPTS